MIEILKYVYTSKEAKRDMGLSYQTVTQWYNRGNLQIMKLKSGGYSSDTPRDGENCRGDQ